MSNDEAQNYTFLLFVANHEAEARNSVAALSEALDQCVAGHYHFEIIDILRNPERADEERVFATPMLVRSHPAPPLRILGDLADAKKVIAMLGLGPFNKP